MVNFDVLIVVKNCLDNFLLVFEIDVFDDVEVQNQLVFMSVDEWGKQVIVMLVIGFYLVNLGSFGGGGLNMGLVLNSIFFSQINVLVGNLKNVSFLMGVEDYDVVDVGGKCIDYSFCYLQCFFNDCFQIVLGGKVFIGVQVMNDVELFIDNIFFEYCFDIFGICYICFFYNKNYESVFEGEIMEIGIGLVLCKCIDRLGELFIFCKKKKIFFEM